MDLLHDEMTTISTAAPPAPGVCIPKMDMSLHWGSCEWILVKTWKADTTGKFIFATIIIFLSAILYEGLKHYREVLIYNSQKSTFTKQADGTLIRSPPKSSLKENLFNISHGIQTFLHGLQVFISYMLMMIVMGANMYLIISICLGAAIGYFSFGWLKKKYACNPDMGECCY